MRSRGSKLKILAVTILTSYNDSDVTEAGYVGSAREQVEKKSLQACALGIDGIVCSAEESAMLRPLIGPDRLLVTPGIRPAGAETGDQKRIMTPAAAIAGGLGLSRGRPPDHRRRRSEGGGGSDRCGSRAGDEKAKGGSDGEGLLDRAGRCVQRRWLQALCRGQSRRSSRNSAAASSCAAASPKRSEGKARSRNVVIEFPDYATALACYNSPEYQANIKVRKPHADGRYPGHRRL